MATFAMTDVTTWVHGHDFTTDLNQISLKADVTDLDKTTFGSEYKARAGGLKNIEMSLNGFWDVTPDTDNFTDLGTMDRVVTVAPTSDEASTAYFMKIGRFKYDMFDEVGSMTPFSLDCMGSNNVGMVRGQVALKKTTVSTTGAKGTAVNIGAATTAVYASLHVFSAGTTITVKVESDDNADFTSATDVASFSAITAAGGTWFVDVGANTDTYYRFNVTAVTGSFSIAGAIGVL